MENFGCCVRDACPRNKRKAAQEAAENLAPKSVDKPTETDFNGDYENLDNSLSTSSHSATTNPVTNPVAYKNDNQLPPSICHAVTQTFKYPSKYDNGGDYNAYAKQNYSANIDYNTATSIPSSAPLSQTSSQNQQQDQQRHQTQYHHKFNVSCGQAVHQSSTSVCASSLRCVCGASTKFYDTTSSSATIYNEFPISLKLKLDNVTSQTMFRCSKACHKSTTYPVVRSQKQRITIPSVRTGPQRLQTAAAPIYQDVVNSDEYFSCSSDTSEEDVPEVDNTDELIQEMPPCSDSDYNRMSRQLNILKLLHKVVNLVNEENSVQISKANVAPYGPTKKPCKPATPHPLEPIIEGASTQLSQSNAPMDYVCATVDKCTSSMKENIDLNCQPSVVEEGCTCTQQPELCPIHGGSTRNDTCQPLEEEQQTDNSCICLNNAEISPVPCRNFKDTAAQTDGDLFEQENVLAEATNEKSDEDNEVECEEEGTNVNVMKIEKVVLIEAKENMKSCECKEPYDPCANFREYAMYALPPQLCEIIPPVWSKQKQRMDTNKSCNLCEKYQEFLKKFSCEGESCRINEECRDMCHEIVIDFLDTVMPLDNAADKGEFYARFRDYVNTTLMEKMCDRYEETSKPETSLIECCCEEMICETNISTEEMINIPRGSRDQQQDSVDNDVVLTKSEGNVVKWSKSKFEACITLGRNICSNLTDKLCNTNQSTKGEKEDKHLQNDNICCMALNEVFNVYDDSDEAERREQYAKIGECIMALLSEYICKDVEQTENIEQLDDEDDDRKKVTEGLDDFKDCLSDDIRIDLIEEFCAISEQCEPTISTREVRSGRLPTEEEEATQEIEELDYAVDRMIHTEELETIGEETDEGTLAKSDQELIRAICANRDFNGSCSQEIINLNLEEFEQDYIFPASNEADFDFDEFDEETELYKEFRAECLKSKKKIKAANQCNCCHCRDKRCQNKSRDLIVAKDVKLNRPEDHMKYFIDSLILDLNSMEHARKKNNLKANICPPKPTECSRESFPVTIVDVTDLGFSALYVKWKIHDCYGIGGYEIYLDGYLTNRYYSSKHQAAVITDVDVTQAHKIALVAQAKTEDHSLDAVLGENANNNECGGMSSRCLAWRCANKDNRCSAKSACQPENSSALWVPSIYLYDPSMKTESPPIAKGLL